MRKFCALLSIALVFSIFFIQGSVDRALSIGVPHIEHGLVSKLTKPESIVFTGDVMLARSVELVMTEYSPLYPFKNMVSFLQKKDLVIGNFEASIPLEHIQTPSLTMQFSVKKEYLTTLKEVGFDVLSLANNHSYDYGESAYNHTMDECAKASLICFGNSLTVGITSIKTISFGDKTIGLVFIHSVFDEPNYDVLKNYIDELQKTTDVQFAYIHWGNEYEPIHSPAQSKLAYFLIDLGIDAVIGHHPHVIQDVERYKGKPIFYSLGNFIFDQYFSNEVQEGYLVEMILSEKSITYKIHPHESIGVRSQPNFMNDLDKSRIFKTLLKDNFFSSDEQKNGVFSVE